MLHLCFCIVCLFVCLTGQVRFKPPSQNLIQKAKLRNFAYACPKCRSRGCVFRPVTWIVYKKMKNQANGNLSDPKSVEHYGDRQQRARTHDLCKSNVQTIFCLEWLWIFTGYMDWTCWWQGFRDDIIILLKKTNMLTLLSPPLCFHFIIWWREVYYWLVRRAGFLVT